MVLKGERLDKPTYQIIRTVQEGNAGVCHEAWHEIFEQRCVQKTVSLLGVSDALAYQEPRLLRSLTHPHLTDVWEAQWDPDFGDKAVTFTMPLYEGGSLYSVLMSDTALSLGTAIGLAADVLDALHFLHVERSIVHRDVKPGNIFLTADLQSAYLGDLGGAAELVDGAADFRGGTPLYRAPESRSNVYTPASDLYSLGMVLRELLGGRLPYESIDYDDVDRRLAEGKRTVPARLLQVPPQVPGRLQQLVNRLLSPIPTDRPDAAITVQRELQNIVHLDWTLLPSAEEPRWLGTAPPSRKGRPSRDVEVLTKKLSRGANSGLIELSARWRERDALRWRGMRRFTVRVSADDQAAWRRFFKSVSDAMLQNSARH